MKTVTHLQLLASALLVSSLLQAAPAEVGKTALSADEAFKVIQKYEHGQDATALLAVERMVGLAVGSPEQRAAMAARLGALLEDPQSSDAAKHFALMQLRLVGGEAQVPIIETMLDDPKSTDMARGTLEAIPGGAAAKALRQALARLRGSALVGAVHSLGVLRAEESARAISQYATGADEALALAAVWSLGRIGTPEAAASLEKAAAGASPKLAASIRDARIECAQRLLWTGRSAEAEAIYRELWGKDQPRLVRIAAFQGLAAVGAPGVLLEGLSSGDAEIEAAALHVSRSVPGEEVSAALIERLGKVEPARKAEIIGILCERQDPLAGRAVAAFALGEGDAERIAALEGVARAGRFEDPTKLIPLIVKPPSPATASAARKALLATGRPKKDVIAALLAQELERSPKAELLEVLGLLGGARALEAVRSHLASADPSLSRTAFEALVNWRDTSAAAFILDLASKEKDLGRRRDALRGYLRLAQLATDTVLFQKARRVAEGPEGKVLLLECLSETTNLAALEMSLSFLGDRDVEKVATEATLRICETLLESHREEVRGALAKLISLERDPSFLARAGELAAEAESPPESRGALERSESRSLAQKKALSRRAPKGYELASYLDCGPDASDGSPGGPSLRLIQGGPYVWEPIDRPGRIRFRTIAFDGREVIFEAMGLKADKGYQVGFTWWDYDHDVRAGSVRFATGKGEKETTALERTKLPSYAVRKEAPREHTLPVPREISAGGTFRIAFRNESGPNVVVSELWLWEGTETPGQKLRVLIVTGDDYPGHPWKETAPVLAAGLRKDPRLDVRVVEDPKFLASDELKDYDVIVLHFMNWEKPDPGTKARSNLQEFVEGGKGLVLVHFACGAFQEWPEFRNLAGRSYDPKLRGHDPWGSFQVEFKKKDHPITEGLKDFETTDELYTCLAGEKPIEILATSRSKVDGKDYPMAFVLDYGKGRVFHSPLGHDARAFENPLVLELFRRACAWAGKLSPVAQ